MSQVMVTEFLIRWTTDLTSMTFLMFFLVVIGVANDRCLEPVFLTPAERFAD